MGNIIEKSKKDLKKLSSRPVISDIVRPSGFLRYFAYRNTMPFVRDLLFFIFDTVQILIIFKYLGLKASSGGMLGYAFVLFVSGFWNTLIYSMREKVLDLNAKKQLSSIPRYFSSLAFSGLLIWAVLVIISVAVLGGFGSDTSVIFSSRILSHGLELYSSLYFFTVYTLTRIYIPFWATIINRAFFLVLPIFLVGSMGVWAFTASFFLEKLIGLWITVRYSKRSLKVRGFESASPAFGLRAKKDLFWFVRSGASSFIKRALTFSLTNLQKLVFLSLVSRYYQYYLLDFFLFYQLMSFFLLIPLRIAKSLYYDVTRLLDRGRYHFMRLLCNYNIIVSILLGAVAVLLFSAVFLKAFPPRFTSLMIELAVMDKWNSIYMLIFFSFGILVVQRVFVVSEAHLSYILSVLLFDYLILGALVFLSPYFLQLGNPIFIFSIQGELSLYYFLAVLLLYLSGIWKKESIIYSANRMNEKALEFNSRSEFLSTVKGNVSGVAVALYLTKAYSGRRRPYSVLEAAKDSFDVRSSFRASRNVILLYMPAGTDIVEQELEVIGRLGVYCERVVFSPLRDFSEKIFKESSYEGFKYEGRNSLALAEERLKGSGIRYKRYMSPYVAVAGRKAQVYELLTMLKEGFCFMPERTLLKKDHFGLIPLIEENKVVGIIEADTKDLEFMKRLIRDLSLNGFFELVSKISNGQAQK